MLPLNEVRADEFTKKQLLKQTPQKKQKVESSHLHVQKNVTSRFQVPQNKRAQLGIVFAVTGIIRFKFGGRFSSQADQNPLKYLFAPDQFLTASARITRWAIAMMRFDSEIKDTPRQQIPMLMF